MTPAEVDQLTGQQLLHAAMVADGRCVHLSEFNALEVFCREARTMERYVDDYIVHVLLPTAVDGFPGYVGSRGPDPITACLRAFIKSRRRHAGPVSASPAIQLP